MPEQATESPAPTEPAAPPVPEIAAAPAEASAGVVADTDAEAEAAVEPEVPAVHAGTDSPGAEKAAELSPAACGARLAALFPALFGPNGPPKPLKLKIQADIQLRAPGVFTRKVLGIFFSRYTTGNAYLKALLHAPHRFDLDGQPAGEIAPEHKAAATEELARRRAIADERRAAEREAQRAAERAAFKARQKAEREAQKSQVVDDQARRDRAFLLRAFESSSLTKANFCALKGVTEAELETQLDQARKERTERPPAPPRAPFPPRAEGPGRGPRPAPPGAPGGRPRGGPPRPAR